MAQDDARAPRSDDGLHPPRPVAARGRGRPHLAEAPADLIRFQDVAAMIPVAERPTMADWLERFHAGLAVTTPAVDLAA